MNLTNSIKRLVQRGGTVVKILSGRDTASIREFIGKKYLKGSGIEIGALDKPMRVPKSVNVQYVDRMGLKDLLKQYPEMASKNLVQTDIIDDGEELRTIEDGTQDFVIANHFLEHCQDPIKAVINAFRVLKPGGILFVAIPDKRFTFDIARESTEFEHLLKDFRDGPEWSRKGHFEEWVRLVGNVRDPDIAARQVEELAKADYSIHYHVWTQLDILDFTINLKKKVGLDLEIELIMKNGDEIVLILSKPRVNANLQDAQ